MKFGFDLDDTITPAPKHMAAIINALKDAGHEIHIITWRHPDYHLEDTRKELKEYGIKYDQLHLTGNKLEVCREWGIDIVLDDDGGHYKGTPNFWIGFFLPKQKTIYMSTKPHIACIDCRTHTEKG